MTPSLLEMMKAKQLAAAAKPQPTPAVSSATQANPAESKAKSLLAKSEPAPDAMLHPVASAGASSNPVAADPQAEILPRVNAPGKSLLAVAQNQLQAKAAELKKEKTDFSYLVAEMPTDFQEVLDRFDKMLGDDNEIDDFKIDSTRNYVKRIMVDLREQPELDGLIIDRDVRNVVRFMRSIRERAGMTLVIKAEKAVTAKKKKETKNRFDMSGVTLDLSANPSTLDDMAEWDV